MVIPYKVKNFTYRIFRVDLYKYYLVFEILWHNYVHNKDDIKKKLIKDNDNLFESIILIDPASNVYDDRWKLVIK